MAKSKDDDAVPAAFVAPELRQSLVGHNAEASMIAQLIARRQFANGWLVQGPEGIGKASFAYAVARAYLSPMMPQLDMATGSADLMSLQDQQVAKLVASRSHPDLFVAERQVNPKTQKLSTEISVETIRQLNQFMTYTSAMGGNRLAIVDTADDMNTNAANALLKTLEEPPANTALLLLTSAPGRLLPTIRSRCRKIVLTPTTLDEVERFLIAEGIAPELAKSAALASGGRPGFALSLAAGEGEAVLKLVDRFLGAGQLEQALRIATALSAKGAETMWDLFQQLLLSRLSASIVDECKAGTKSAQIEHRLAAREALTALFDRGARVNLDRTQVILAAHRILTGVDRGVAAGARVS